MNYKVEMKEINPCKLKLDFLVSNEEVQLQTSKAYSDIQQKAKIGGFRPGKVPMEIIKQKFTSNAKELVVENILREVVPLTIKEKNLNPVITPVVEKMDFDFNKPFSFTVIIENYPEVEAKNYKNLKIKKVIKDITDKDIETELKTLQKYHTRLEESKSDIPAKNDCVYVNYQIFCNNEHIKELSVDNQIIDLEQKYILPELVENLLKMKKDEQKEIEIKLPDNLTNKKFAGKDVLLKLKLISIKNKLLPEIDDEFAKDLECENIVELKKKIKEYLHQHAEQQAHREYKEKIIDKLLETNKFDVPEILVEKQKKYLIDLAKQQMSSQRISEELINNQIASMTNNFAKQAEKDVKVFFIMESIAKQENITVSEDDMKEYRETMLKANAGKESMLQEYFKISADKIKADILFNKVEKILMTGG